MVSRIAVIGSINVDLVTYVERVPAAGETLAAAGFELHHGGTGANQAVAAALLGSDVLMVGKIGTGVFGDEALANLRALGIDASHVTRAAAPTGVASILVEPSGENRIMIVAGANAQLAPEDIDRAAAELARCQMMLLQLEVPLATVYHAIRVAQAAPYRDGFSHTSLSGVAFLVPNRVELAQISGQAGIESAARALVREGVHTVIVTLGAAGALIVTHHTSTPIPAVPVEPIDTTGAGDAFIGAFAHFFARTGDVAAAARSAAAYAALATTRRGAQASFADAAEFHAFTPAGTPA
jgi:ribokinase